MGLRALVFIQDAELGELIHDLLRPGDEVLALWPPSEELGWDGLALGATGSPVVHRAANHLRQLSPRRPPATGALPGAAETHPAPSSLPR